MRIVDKEIIKVITFIAIIKFMCQIICVGSASKDMFFPTSEGAVSETPEDLMSQRKITFELGAKYHIGKRHEALGGCAANVAVGLARLGLDVGCYATVGSDVTGQWIFTELANEGVRPDLVETVRGAISDLSAIVVDEKSGERVIFTNRQVGGALEVQVEKLENTEWIFIGDISGEWKSDVDNILKVAEDKKIKLAFNPREKMLREDVKKIIETIKKCAVVFVNKDEALEIVSAAHDKSSKENLNDSMYLVRQLKEICPGTVVLTDGKNGAWTMESKDIYFAPALELKPVETTGAGDAFASGFLAACVKELPLETALRWGAANSSHSIKFFGAISGLLREKEIEKIMGEINARKII